MIMAIEHHVDWIIECITVIDDQGASTIEPAPEAVEDWVAHVNEVAERTMYTAPSCNSWYLGSNIDGKARVFMPYVGGLGRYRRHYAEVVTDGYRGFLIS